MFERLNKITFKQAALIITVLGFVTYFDGLKNVFFGDDLSQIVNNPVVHSIKHINPTRLFLLAVFIIGIFCIRSALRGLDYRNQYTLAQDDISVSSQDFYAATIPSKEVWKN